MNEADSCVEREQRDRLMCRTGTGVFVLNILDSKKDRSRQNVFCASVCLEGGDKTEKNTQSSLLIVAFSSGFCYYIWMDC